jgi:hypothetical protein
MIDQPHQSMAYELARPPTSKRQGVVDAGRPWLTMSAASRREGQIFGAERIPAPQLVRAEREVTTEKLRKESNLRLPDLQSVGSAVQWLCQMGCALWLVVDQVTRGSTCVRVSLSACITERPRIKRLTSQSCDRATKLDDGFRGVDDGIW